MAEESRAARDGLEAPTEADSRIRRLEGTPSYVVGIAASAGGLDALERFFERMPLDTGSTPTTAVRIATSTSL